MNSKDDLEPENPLQHTKVKMTMRKYANSFSVTHLGAEARVLENGYKVSNDPTGLLRMV